MNKRQNNIDAELRKAELGVMIFKEGMGALTCRNYKLPLSDYVLMGELAAEAQERLLNVNCKIKERDAV